MGQIKNIKLHIVTDIKRKTITTSNDKIFLIEDRRQQYSTPTCHKNTTNNINNNNNNNNTMTGMDMDYCEPQHGSDLCKTRSPPMIRKKSKRNKQAKVVRHSESKMNTIRDENEDPDINNINAVICKT